MVTQSSIMHPEEEKPFRKNLSKQRRILNKNSLFNACKGGNKDLVAKVLEGGVCPHVKNNNGENPLHVGATWSTEEVVKLLLDLKVDISEEDQYKNTPLEAVYAFW